MCGWDYYGWVGEGEGGRVNVVRVGGGREESEGEGAGGRGRGRGEDGVRQQSAESAIGWHVPETQAKA